MVFDVDFEGFLVEAGDLCNYGDVVGVLEHVDEGFGFFVFAFAEFFGEAVFLGVFVSGGKVFHVRVFGGLFGVDFEGFKV